MLPILQLGNEQLIQKSQPISDINDKTIELINEMITTMHEGRGIGLAAPQVGELGRIFVVHIDNDKPRVFINPEIILTSTETESYEEGCLSIPGLFADVIRSSFIKIQAFNEKGKPFSLEADGLLARVILHEYDHLNGVLFIDRLSEIKKKRIVTLWEKKLRA